MDLYKFWCRFLTPAGVIVPWCFSNLELTHKINIVVFVVLLSLSFYCLHLRNQLEAQQKELDSTTEKHRALASRFEAKQNETRRYREAFTSIDHLIASTVQSSGKDRLNTLYEYFMKVKNALISENTEGE